MQIIYIYLAETMENIAQPMAVSYDEFKSDPNRFYPPWNSETMIFSDKLVTNAILDEKSRELREMTKDELYKARKYTLAENELIENGKIKTVNLSEYEYIENNQIKFKREEKIEALKKELYTLRIEKEKEPFEFEVNGTKYLQYNRTIDQSNITKILFSLIMNFVFSLLKKVAAGTKIEITQILAQLSEVRYPSWKFYTVDDSEKYESVSVMQFIEMSKLMQKMTTVSMQSETVLSHSLINKTDEELKNFNASEEYKKFFDEAYKDME